MLRLVSSIVAFFGLLAGVLGSNDAFTLGSLKNIHIEQNVDLTHSYVKQNFAVEVENIGSEPEPVYVVSVPEAWASSLAGLEARGAGDTFLPVRPLDPHTVAGHALYTITFEQPLQPKEKLAFSYVLAYVDGVSPLPASAKQADAQWLLYRATRNTVSVYETETQETLIKVLIDGYEDLTADEHKDSAKTDAGGLLTYGPYKDIEALAELPLALRFQNPLPILRVEDAVRTIWVSHWGGSVSFDESYDFHNGGTRLERFSRSDFAKPHASFNLNNAAIRYLGLRLPKGHREEYYVDQVGNVSTSRVNPGVLEILPRYPIMGGWFYNFTVGWASDVSNFVHSPVPDNFILSVPMLGGPESTSYKKATTKIVLPEGATDIEVFSELPYKKLSEYVTYSYLDIYGRPTVELEYENLVSDYGNADIFVTYRYTTSAALRKPISYAAAVFVTLASVHYLLKVFQS